MRKPQNFKDLETKAGGALEVVRAKNRNDRYSIVYTNPAETDIKILMAIVSVVPGRFLHSLKMKVPGEEDQTRTLGWAFTREGAARFAYQKADEIAHKWSPYHFKSVHSRMNDGMDLSQYPPQQHRDSGETQ